MTHLTIVPDEFDPQPDVRWLTNPEGDHPILTEE